MNKKFKISVFSTLLFGLVLIAGLSLWFFGGDKSDNGTILAVPDKVYVAAEEEGVVAVVSVKEQKVIKQISLNEEINGINVSFMPHNIQVAPDNKSVWVTGNAMDMSSAKVSFWKIKTALADVGHDDGAIEINDQVIVIDPTTDKIIKRIELGTGLHLSHVALTPDSSYAIVAAQEIGAIYKINARTYEVEKTINANKSDQPHGLRISPDGKTAYIAMLGGKSIGVLDIGNFSLSYVPLKGAAVQSGVTPDGKYALASVYDTKSLAVYDIVAKKLNYIDLPVEAKGPVQIYPSPDSRYVYVADQGYYFNQPKSDLVYKVDLARMKVAQTIKAGEAPHGVAVSKDGSLVYVTNLLSNDLSVIDSAKGKEIARIAIGKMPNGVSLFYADDSLVSKNQDGKGYLSASEDSFDFGVVSMARGNVKHSFRIRNTGTAPVKISKVYTSCMCTEATLVFDGKDKTHGPFGMRGHGYMSPINEIVTPGEEFIVEAEVDPAAHGPQGTGPAKKAIYIETDAMSEPMKLMMDINVIQ